MGSPTNRLARVGPVKLIAVIHDIPRSDTGRPNGIGLNIAVNDILAFENIVFLNCSSTFYFVADLPLFLVQLSFK